MRDSGHRVTATAAALLGVALCVAGCYRSPAPPPVGRAAAPQPPKLPPAAQLAARAALAQDQYYSASYRFTPNDGSPPGAARVQRSRQGFLLELTEPPDATRTLRTTVVVQNKAGLFQCRLTPAASACVSAARSTQASSVDDGPRLPFAFTDWLGILADPAAALSVTSAPTPRGVIGSCFSVEGVAAALDPPVDPGLYCFDDAGRITALKLAQGMLTVAEIGPAAPTVALPAPVTRVLPPVNGPPPAPPASPSGTPGASPAPRPPAARAAAG